MNGHDIGTYRDDWLLVSYCKKCGKEGMELAMVECAGEIKKKEVDKKEEPH